MRQVEVFKAVRNRKAVLPIAVVFNEAEDSPQHAPRLLVGNETSVLVDQALRRQLSRATHLSECVDVEGLSLSKDRVGDQAVQAEPETAIDESPDVARLAGGLPTGFVVVGLHEAVVGFVPQEIRPAKQWADFSPSQRLNILCSGIELWLQPRSRVPAQGKRPVVVMERERHATPGPKQPGCRHGSARQFDLLLPKAQAGWRWKAFPLGYAPEIHDERCCRRFLLYDFLHLATERHAVFQRAVAFGVSTRISGQEDKYVGAPQLGHGVPQMRETLGQFGLVARAENPGEVSAQSTVRPRPLLHTGEQDDPHAEPLVMRQRDCGGHVLVVLWQQVRARAKSGFAEFQVVIAAGFEEVIDSGVLRRRIGRKGGVQPNSRETACVLRRATCFPLDHRGILKQKRSDGRSKDGPEKASAIHAVSHTPLQLTLKTWAMLIQDEWIGTYTKRHGSAVDRERPRTNTCDREDAGWKLPRQDSNLRPVASASRASLPLIVQVRLKQNRTFRQSNGRPAKSRPRNRHRNRHRASGA